MKTDDLLRACVGLDIGRLSDPSALALLTWRVPPHAQPEPSAPAWWKPPVELVSQAPKPARPAKHVYSIPTLHRWSLGTAYTTITRDVVKFFEKPPVCEVAYPVLVVDATGVGDAVCEALAEEMRRAKVRGGIVMVSITGGSATTLVSSGKWHVAKKQLVSCMRVVFGNDRLRIASELAEAKELAKELGTFQVKLNPETGNESFEAWREKDKDDLVLAVALATWVAETLKWPS